MTSVEFESRGEDAPDAEEERYDVFVQWQRGKPHEYAETVNASDPEMAFLLARRNVDVRAEPISIWVAPRSAMYQSDMDDATLAPSTDRSYREVAYYAQGGDYGSEELAEEAAAEEGSQ